MKLTTFLWAKDKFPHISNIASKMLHNKVTRVVAAEEKTRDFRISEFGLSTQGFRSKLTAFYDPGSTYIAALLRRSEYGQRGKRI